MQVLGRTHSPLVALLELFAVMKPGALLLRPDILHQEHRFRYVPHLIQLSQLTGKWRALNCPLSPCPPCSSPSFSTWPAHTLCALSASDYQPIGSVGPHCASGPLSCQDPHCWQFYVHCRSCSCPPAPFQIKSPFPALPRHMRALWCSVSLCYPTDPQASSSARRSSRGKSLDNVCGRLGGRERGSFPVKRTAM
jgi:hypothetical protein